MAGIPNSRLSRRASWRSHLYASQDFFEGLERHHKRQSRIRDSTVRIAIFLEQFVVLKFRVTITVMSLEEGANKRYFIVATHRYELVIAKEGFYNFCQLCHY